MKNNEKRGVSKRTVAILLALVLVIGCAVGGTLAWLTAQTQAVQNTFTPSDINIGLKETTGNTYKMVPGYTITKDPKVWVDSGSEDCYLFVKLDWANNTFTDKNNATQNYLSYTIGDGWTQVPSTDNVWYREVTSTGMSPNKGESNSYPVLLNNTLTVNRDVTKTEMNALEADSSKQPTLTVTAYACQLYSTNGQKFDVGTAWTNASNQQS